MRAATAVIALFAVVLILTAPSRAAAQGNPFPSGGGGAAQMLPGDEGAITTTPSPLQSLLSLLTYPAIARRVSEWMPASATVAPTRAYASSHSARSAMQRRAAYGRTSR